MYHLVKTPLIYASS